MHMTTMHNVKRYTENRLFRRSWTSLELYYKKKKNTYKRTKLRTRSIEDVSLRNNTLVAPSQVNF